MTDGKTTPGTFGFDGATRALVRLAARIAGGSELDVRAGLAEAAASATPVAWMEEVLLQSYLFAGFPRALNAMREYRRAAGEAGRASAAEGATGSAAFGDAEMDFLALGEATCARVYGAFYEKLRANVAHLHPDLDRWMIVEGYGKVLSRPALDLGRRELCIVAACAASGQDRQLHSHLHGARNVGVSDAAIAATLDSLDGAVAAENLQRAQALWVKVRGQ